LKITALQANIHAGYRPELECFNLVACYLRRYVTPDEFLSVKPDGFLSDKPDEFLSDK